MTIPSWSTALWGVAIWGYNSHVFLICLLAYCLANSHFKTALAVSVFSTFTIGSGISVFAFGGLYFLYKLIGDKKSNLTYLLLWIIVGLTCAGALFAILSETLSRPENSTSEGFNILSMLNYNVLFLFNGLKPTESFIPVVMIAAYFILVVAGIGMWYYRKNINSDGIIALGALGTVAANGLISSLFRTNHSEVLANVPDRYDVFSFLFLSLLYLITMILIRNENKLKVHIFLASIIFLCSGIYFAKVTISVAGLERAEESIKNRMINALVDNRKAPKTYHILNYVNNGLYKPPYEIVSNEQFEPINNALENDVVPATNENIKILSNYTSEHFNLVEVYAPEEFNYQMKLFINNTHLSPLERVPLFKLTNFKSYRKQFPKEAYKDKSGYVISFHQKRNLDQNSYLLILDENDKLQYKIPI